MRSGVADSRIRSRPAVWSISASVSSTPATGGARTPSTGAANASSCSRRSGEALTRNHGPSAPRIASDDWVRGTAPAPSRAASHTPQWQFHCGNPPPAAEPRTRTRTWPQAQAEATSRLRLLPMEQVRRDLGTQLVDLKLGLYPRHL